MPFIAIIGAVKHPQNILQEYLEIWGYTEKCKAVLMSWLSGFHKTKQDKGDPSPWIFVNQQELATQLKWNKNTIGKHLRDLCDMGVLEWKPATKSPFDRRKKYRINMAVLTKLVEEANGKKLFNLQDPKTDSPETLIGLDKLDTGCPILETSSPITKDGNNLNSLFLNLSLKEKDTHTHTTHVREAEEKGQTEEKRFGSTDWVETDSKGLSVESIPTDQIPVDSQTIFPRSDGGIYTHPESNPEKTNVSGLTKRATSTAVLERPANPDGPWLVDGEFDSEFVTYWAKNWKKSKNASFSEMELEAIAACVCNHFRSNVRSLEEKWKAYAVAKLQVLTVLPTEEAPVQAKSVVERVQVGGLTYSTTQVEKAHELKAKHDCGEINLRHDSLEFRQVGQVFLADILLSYRKSGIFGNSGENDIVPEFAEFIMKRDRKVAKDRIYATRWVNNCERSMRWDELREAVVAYLSPKSEDVPEQTPQSSIDRKKFFEWAGDF